LRFEWDPNKAKVNLKKQGITFEESSTVFGDPFSFTIDDPDHSEGEHRLLVLGRSMNQRILVVSSTYRGHSIRIITSGEADPKERRLYEEERKNV
jgi:hypothetical protein